MRTITTAFFVFLLALALAIPAAAAKNTTCTEYGFPDGFGVAAFGMSKEDIGGFDRCGLVSLGEEEGVYSAAGKLGTARIEPVDVIFEFTLTPKAKKLYQITMETLSMDLFKALRDEATAKYGQPSQDDKGREVWTDKNAGVSYKMYRTKRYFKVRTVSDSFLLEEAMGFYTDEHYSLPAGYGPFKFGISKEDALKGLGCGFQFVSRDNTRITLKGYAFNQPAKIFLDFSGGQTLTSMEFEVDAVDSFPLIESVITDKYGPAQVSGQGRLWQVDSAQISLTKGTPIRIRYVWTGAQ